MRNGMEIFTVVHKKGPNYIAPEILIRKTKRKKNRQQQAKTRYD